MRGSQKVKTPAGRAAPCGTSAENPEAQEKMRDTSREGNSGNRAGWHTASTSFKVSKNGLSGGARRQRPTSGPFKITSTRLSSTARAKRTRPGDASNGGGGHGLPRAEKGTSSCAQARFVSKGLRTCTASRHSCRWSALLSVAAAKSSLIALLRALAPPPHSKYTRRTAPPTQNDAQSNCACTFAHSTLRSTNLLTNLTYALKIARAWLNLRMLTLFCAASGAIL